MLRHFTKKQKCQPAGGAAGKVRGLGQSGPLKLPFLQPENDKLQPYEELCA